MDAQSERLVAATREILKSYGFFVDNLWHANDILFLCEQLSYEKLSLEDCMEVFEIANAQFDGEYGMNWPELERALKTFMHHKKMLKTAYEKEAEEIDPVG